MRPKRTAFTLIELLVVVAIIGLLVSILLPTLTAARKEARSALCLSRLMVFGQGLVIYVGENRDILPPSRLPKIDNCNSYAFIFGRKKYRPTFVASMSRSVGVPPFDDPKPCKDDVDMHGQPGDKQNYSYPLYVCPVVADWTDERNGAYGWNYQFLGNSRLLDSNDLGSFKNWPVQITSIKYPGRTVAMGDSMGCAAAFAPQDRLPYLDNAKEPERYGDEGFNLDPPLIDPVNGEIAHGDTGSRSAADPRHRDRANILWLDGHAAGHSLEYLGYQRETDGSVGLDGENVMWSGNGRDVAWTPEFTP